MPSALPSIRRLLEWILILAIFLAAIRSGSDGWLKVVYTATFLTLVYAAIAARYRGPFWFGFAAAGWAYFLVAFNYLHGPNRFDPVNRNLATDVLLEILTSVVDRSADPPTGYVMSIGSTRPTPWSENVTNRAGIGHSGLTLLLAIAGGRLASAMARRATAPGPTSAVPTPGERR